jgi:hypothetical protein
VPAWLLMASLFAVGRIKWIEGSQFTGKDKVSRV